MTATSSNINILYIKCFFDQDPTLISNVTGYEPYQNMTATNSNIKWPENGIIPNGSKNDRNDLLGYVSISVIVLSYHRSQYFRIEFCLLS